MSRAVSFTLSTARRRVRRRGFRLRLDPVHFKRGAVSSVIASEPAWPQAEQRRLLFLVDAASAYEDELIRQWIERNNPGLAPESYDAVPIPPSRRAQKRTLDPRLEARLATTDDLLLAPVRVAWHPPQRDGARTARFADLLTSGDPRDPGPWRQQWIHRRHPDRVTIVLGEPAPLSELRERWRTAGGTDPVLTTGLAEFVARQATLALERAERRLRGARYKVPRLVHEQILARPVFRGGVAKLARDLGMSEADAAAEASGYLREVAATHSTLVIDLVANLIRYLYRQGYDEALHYDREALESVYELAQRHPVVFLPSHKSNLDHLVLQYALHENGHPPNHTAGGINMNFMPVGPLVRRSGVFFIRRTFKDNHVYKFVLKQYVDYLIEKRFPLEWYIEGGRSRSGKLLPPRFGMLAYVVDSYRRAKSDDVYLVPVSIAYDQIHDVGDYAAEQRGGAKEKESFGWFLKVIRALRRQYGRIHINFGEPLSLAETLGPPTPEAAGNVDDEQSVALQKLAFEVSVRINRVTPITPTSLVTLALLGTFDRALTVDEIVRGLTNLIDYVEGRALPTTEPLRLRDEAGVRATLEQLVDNGVVTCFAEGPDAVYRISEDQHLAAAYYRNTIIHFFVNGAIAELALLAAAEKGGDLVAGFWADAMALRDLLKFEFFFADKESFRVEMNEELSRHLPDWEAQLRGGADVVQTIVPKIRPYSAHRVLRPFVEAYQVVADALVKMGTTVDVDEKAFLSQCLALGKQYHLQRRIRSAESVSKVLFETALKLARNRDLVGAPRDDVGEARQSFAREVRGVVRRIDVIGTLAASRFTGLIE